MATKLNTLQDLREKLNSKYLERKDLIDGMLVSLVSGEPLLMIGPPGTAKSMICQDICKAFQGQYYDWMLSKLTVPEELFGPLSLKGLENDKYIRITDGMLPQANIAFLDEVFKGSSAILNTLLTVLNEKIFYNGGKPVDVPLVTLFAASNEIPTSEELSAFYDRFVLKYAVEYVKKEESCKALFMGLNDVKMPKMSMATINDEKGQAYKVQMSNAVVDLLIEIRRQIEKDGILVSDRKWVQSVRVIKAYTHINGRTKVESDDLDILANILWATPDQRTKVRRTVSRLSNPMGDKILQVMDSISEVMRDLSNNKGDAVEVFKKLKIGIKEIEKLGDPKRNAKVEAAMQAIRGYQQEIAKKHLGLMD